MSNLKLLNDLWDISSVNIRSAYPAGCSSTSTASEIVGAAEQGELYIWSLNAACTYTPVQDSGGWTYVLLNPINSAMYVLFLAFRVNKKEVYMFGNGAWDCIYGRDIKAYDNVVDLSGYDTSGNMYTFPSDGYLFLANNDPNTGSGVIAGGGSSTGYLRIGGNKGRWTLPVKAGMKAWHDGVTNIFRFVY